MSPIDVTQRRQALLESLEREPPDLLVIGGGIVGAGVARDAAMRGLRVALVDQHDFAFGTSGRSSRLLHGGIRYLAQGRLRLVYEASSEKRIVHRIAPHLARPMAFVFPAYRGTDWPLWQLRIGVKLYDLLCAGKNFGGSSGLSREETLARAPGLKEEGLAGAVRYYDAFTNDARLVLDTLRSAARHGASLLNYARFSDARRQSGYWECDLRDRLLDGPRRIRARAIVNATGPWAGEVPRSSVRPRLTKGIHLVLERGRFSLADAVVITEGKRVLFVIPWGERVILGTTDTDYSGPLDRVEAEPEEINHLLGVANRFFPKLGLTEADIISTWAGLRPLMAAGRGKPSDISRRHEIRNPEPGWWDAAGGKLTTYRLIAEQTVDAVVSKLKLNARACETAEVPLLPPSETEGISGVLPPVLSQEVVRHFCENEWAVHLDDVMIRRAGWARHNEEARDIAASVSHWMAGLLGWTEERRKSELHG